MTIAQLFAKFFGPVEREAGIVAHHVEADAHSAVQFARKELEMIPQPIQDLISQIAAALSSHSNQSAADAATISGLSAQCSDLTVQVRDKESQIGALTQQVSDLNGEVNDIQAALAAALAAAAAPAPAPAPAVDPAAAPADGSASADPTP